MKLKFMLALLCLAFCLVSCGDSGNVNETTGTDAETAVSDAVIENSGGVIYKIDLSNPKSANGIAGISFANGELKITKAGSYTVTGKLEDGMIIVSAGKKDTVELVLNSAEVKNSDGPALYVAKADKVYVSLADKTDNKLSDGDSYEVTEDGSNLDGAVFSKADLIIRGSGKLTVNGNNKHGIVCKDDLTIVEGTLNVKSKNVALNGKDSVSISDASVTLDAGSDGIRSDNTEYIDRGYVMIESGKVNIISVNDGIQAETFLKVTGGEISITSGGGSKKTVKEESAKALKAGGVIELSGGNIRVDSADDSVHSNTDVTVSGGKIYAVSGDDGIHADGKVEIKGAEIEITKSYEGIEASEIVISGGQTLITASDDGMNAAGGNDSSSLGDRPGQGMFEETSGSITLSGGFMKIDASGDGIDSNGPITLSGGVFLISGPTNGGNGAFDYSGEAKVTGGVLIATGSVGMASGFSTAENQGAMLVNTGSQTEGTALTVCDKDGNVVVSFAPEKAYQCAVVTAPGITVGETYTIKTGGEATDADSYGYASKGTLDGGEVVTNISLTDNIYNDNGLGMMGPGGMGPGGNRPLEDLGPGGNRPPEEMRPGDNIPPEDMGPGEKHPDGKRPDGMI